jgi:hypothetical protein
MVAFEGTKSDTFPSSLKGITVDPTCVKTIIPETDEELFVPKDTTFVQ